MENNYWKVINLYRAAVAGTLDENMLVEARLVLSKALDRVVVGGLPSNEIERLIGALDELSDKIEEI